MASILRHRQRRDFTILPNSAIRDAALSLRAGGLLQYLLMMPDGTPVDSLGISRRKPEGRDAIRTAFRELETAGYVRRSKEQNDAGQWTTVIEVTDEPETGFQASGDRSLETRTSADSALSLTKDGEARTPRRPPRGGDDDEEFAAFWRVCVRKAGKGQARRAWRRAVKKKPGTELVEAMAEFARTMAAMNVSQEFVPHPASWLNGERWDDEPPVDAEPGGPRVAACELCDDRRWVFPEESDDNEVVPCPRCRRGSATVRP